MYLVVFYLTLILLMNKFHSTLGITCFDVQEKGSGSSFKMEELESLASLSPEDLSRCTALLGKEQLSSNQSNAIWTSFVKVYDGAENIPEDQLQQMGWVINGIPPAHFANLSLTDVDTIASFGRCRELSPQQLESLKDAISEQWIGKDLKDFSSFDLIALRQVLCAFNSSLIQMIHPDAYKDAAPELATIANCSQEVLKELARLAVDEEAFGDPHAWTSVQAGSVGCVMAGLSAITDVPPDAFEGLTANIIDCMPTEIFQAMTTAQIARLSPSAAAALTRKKITMSGDKKYALKISGSSKAAMKSASEQLPEPSCTVVIGLTAFSIEMVAKMNPIRLNCVPPITRAQYSGYPIRYYLYADPSCSEKVAQLSLTLPKRSTQRRFFKLGHHYLGVADKNQ